MDSYVSTVEYCSEVALEEEHARAYYMVGIQESNWEGAWWVSKGDFLYRVHRKDFNVVGNYGEFEPK